MNYIISGTNNKLQKILNHLLWKIKYDYFIRRVLWKIKYDYFIRRAWYQFWGEKYAVKQSIKHWKKDVLYNFLKGDYIVLMHGVLQWKKSKKNLKYRSDSCALCVFNKDYCNNCLLHKKGYGCIFPTSGYSPWYCFVCNTNQVNAERMIQALKDLLN